MNELHDEKACLATSAVRSATLISLIKQLLYEPPHDKKQQNDCAPSEDSDQAGHPPSAPSEDSDQAGHPPSLIRVFALRSVGSYGPKLSSHSGEITSDLER